MPHELSLFGVYISPLLAVFAVSALLAALTAWLLNITRLSAWLRLHQWLFFIILIIYACLLDRYWIGA